MRSGVEYKHPEASKNHNSKLLRMASISRYIMKERGFHFSCVKKENEAQLTAGEFISLSNLVNHTQPTSLI